MKFNSLLSLFGSNGSGDSSQDNPTEPAFNPEMTTSEFSSSSADEQLNSPEPEEMFVEPAEMNSFNDDDLPSDQKPLDEIIQSAAADDETKDQEFFYIDESNPNGLLELDNFDSAG